MHPEPSSGDLTPIAGAQTDVAPLGRDQPPPAHEQPASGSAAYWERVASTPEFHQLLSAKLRFIIPATTFFVVYYFILPISVGWFPDVMKKEVLGRVNLAYVFAFSQF